MNVRCPTCGAAIGLDDVNVARDLAVCRSCKAIFTFSDNVDIDLSEEDSDNPPRGTWFDRTFDGFVAGATTRSPIAFFLVPFMCIWSGGSLGGIYGGQIVRGKFNLVSSLFGVPFLLGTIVFGGFAVMSVIGRVVVSVSGDDGVIFTGVGPIGWRRRFSWDGARSVGTSISSSNDGNPSRSIRIVGTVPFTFGSMLTEPRRRYLAGVLRREHQRRGKPTKPCADDLFAE